jgi:hypothetical protein
MILQISTAFKISSTAWALRAGSGLQAPPRRKQGLVQVLMLQVVMDIPSSGRKPSRARSMASKSRGPFSSFWKTCWWISTASMPAALVRRHWASKSLLKFGSSEWYPTGANRSTKSPADQCPTLILMSRALRKLMARSLSRGVVRLSAKAI